jgi:cold shock CspA family protein
MLHERGYGFIQRDGGGPDLFFSAHRLHEGVRFDADLREGLPVSFALALRRDRREQAVDVRPSCRPTHR